MRVFRLAVAVLASIALMAASFLHRVPFEPDEAFGVVTGAWCVWLAVRQHLWNWPIGVASSIFFVLLFWHKRLYGDMGLNIVYVILGILGWYWWLHGGQNQGRLAVSRTTRMTAVVLTLFVIVCTAGMTVYFQRIHDAAPFLDALTTALSLAAQYQITKKLFENWYVWIVADTIYVGLYLYKGLFLTAVLYGLFIALCVFGLRDWRRSLYQPQAADQDKVFETEGVWPPTLNTTGSDEALEIPHG